MQTAPALQKKDHTKSLEHASTKAHDTNVDLRKEVGFGTGLPLFLQRFATDPLYTPLPLQRQPDGENKEELLQAKSFEGVVQHHVFDEDDEEITKTNAGEKPIQKKSAVENEEIGETQISPKLMFGEPDDKFEREADKVAEQVMRRPEPEDPENEEGRVAFKKIKPMARHIAPLAQSKIEPKKEENETAVQKFAMQRQGESEEKEGPLEALSIQRQEEEEKAVQLSEIGVVEGPSSQLSMSAIVTQAIQSESSGELINLSTRSALEAGIGTDLSDVRVHSDEASHEAAGRIKAKAFTHKNHIWLGRGQSQNDLRLMAHETAHVIQQRAAHNYSKVQCVPRDQEKKKKKEETSDLSIDDELLLLWYRIELANEDKLKLAKLFPDGFWLHKDEVYITGVGESVQSTRISAIRVSDRSPLRGQAARVYLFKLQAKGRSILVASSSGADSVLLDAGVGQVRADQSSRAVTSLVNDLSNLVSSGQATTPTKVVISHVDVDHYNAVRQLLGRSMFSRMSIEIAVDLISGGQARKWRSMALNVDRNRQVIEVQVVGNQGSVDARAQVFDGFQLIEYRSVSAHGAARSKSTYNKNRTSPVSVVIDRVTRERYIFTSDAEGRQFSEVIDSMGERAFRRLIGSAQNLRLFEAPHHGGKVSTNLDARSMLRMLWFVMEASGGKADIVAQTSAGFAEKPSESLRFLELIGIEPHRIQGTDAPAGQSQAERVIGAKMETINYNAEGIRQTRELIRNYESDLRKGFKKHAEINDMRSQYRAAQRVMKQFEIAGSSKVADALGNTLQELNQTGKGMQSHLRKIFSAIGSAAETTGMTRNTNVAEVRTATGNMNTHRRAVNLESHKASLNATYANMNLQQRLMVNTVNMLEAGLKEDFGRMGTLKAERRQLEKLARKVLGNTLVSKHIKNAWDSTGKAESTRQSRVLQELLLRGTSRSKARMTATRIISGESLSRQLALHNLVEQASHGKLPSVRPISARTRIGSGFLALLEIGRIGLEFASIAKEANEANKRWLKALELEGYSAVAWWTTRGAIPRLALIKKNWWAGWDVVSKNFTQSQIQTMIDREINNKVGGKGDEGTDRIPNMPEGARVVIDSVPDDQVVAIIKAQYHALNTLDEYQSWNNSFPGGPLFKKFGDKWGIRYWSEKNDKYIYYTQTAIQEPLNILMETLAEGTKARFKEMRENADELCSVRDRAWFFGTDRIVYVYNRYGRLIKYDFDDYDPRFVKVGKRWEGWKQYIVVQAADLGTYKRLYKKGWKIQSEGQRWHFYDASGHSGVSYDKPWNPVYLNEWGYALVDEDDLMIELGHSTNKRLKGIKSSGAE